MCCRLPIAYSYGSLASSTPKIMPIVGVPAFVPLHCVGGCCTTISLPNLYGIADPLNGISYPALSAAGCSVHVLLPYVVEPYGETKTALCSLRQPLQPFKRFP